MVYPIDGYLGKTKAHEIVWNKLDLFDDSNLVALFEIILDEEQIDCILMDSEGIIILAINDYIPKMVRGVTDKKMIQLNNRPTDYSSMERAIKWRKKLIKAINRCNTDGNFITVACCYPFIDYEEYYTSGLEKISPIELTFLCEDFVDKEHFDNKKSSLFKFVKGYNNINEEKCLSNDEIEEIGNCILPHYSELITQNKSKRVNELDVDLHANSNKELFYGICSFLMRNGITSGNIYSKSHAILDGLGDYMSRTNIPWSYANDENTIGYVLVDGDAPENVLRTNEVIIDINNESRITIKQGRKKHYSIAIHNINTIYDELSVSEETIPLHLKNEQIRTMFLKSFLVAESEIDIICPWMNFGVVNDRFVELIRAALDRGVKIKILYGLKPDSSEYNISRSNRSDQVAKFLRETFAKYGKLLVIKRDNIHYKLVLCDEKFKLEGGYNYLSFVGDYSNEDTRTEGSPYGTRIDEIRYLRKEYFGNV
jgi:hypothetical protein